MKMVPRRLSLVSSFQLLRVARASNQMTIQSSRRLVPSTTSSKSWLQVVSNLKIMKMLPSNYLSAAGAAKWFLIQCGARIPKKRDKARKFLKTTRNSWLTEWLVRKSSCKLLAQTIPWAENQAPNAVRKRPKSLGSRDFRPTIRTMCLILRFWNRF